MKNTLKDYISNACHYVFPAGNPDGLERQRNCFIRYCEKYHLDERFLALVAEDREWRDLASDNQVYFFENEYKSALNGDRKPSISLLRTEGGKVPVIKLIIKSYAEYGA